MNKTRSDCLRMELKALISRKSLLTLSSLKGQIEWIARTREVHLHVPETWVLRAHEGTVEKFESVLAGSSLQSGVELIALARNIFENLIWLKLFNKDRHYGLLFYRELLKQQIQSQEQAIEKATEEISLFRELSNEESPDFDAIEHLFVDGAKNGENAKNIHDYIKAHEAVVDAKVRATFSLYGHQAKTNGFDYQAHIIETEAIPHHRERIAIVKIHLSDLENSLPTGLATTMQRELDDPVRWNWSKRAASVGMSSHYNFLYSYTSRLLHATPMNLITPKNLDESEICTLLDYIFVAVSEAYVEIETFSYPGKVNTFFVEEGAA